MLGNFYSLLHTHIFWKGNVQCGWRGKASLRLRWLVTMQNVGFYYSQFFCLTRMQSAKSHCNWMMGMHIFLPFLFYCIQHLDKFGWQERKLISAVCLTVKLIWKHFEILPKRIIKVLRAAAAEAVCCWTRQIVFRETFGEERESSQKYLHKIWEAEKQHLIGLSDSRLFLEKANIWAGKRAKIKVQWCREHCCIKGYENLGLIK